MPLSRIAKISILTSVAVAFFLIISWYFLINDRKQAILEKDAAAVQAGSNNPHRMKGLSYSSFDDKNNLLANLEADEFRIGQRRFWMFNIRPLKEATIDNARFKLYLDKNSSSRSDIFSFTEKFLSLDNGGKATGGSGLISRGVINGLSFDVFRGDTELIRVKAEKAYIDFRKKRMKLISASIDDVENKKIIKSGLVFWNDKDKSFDVPGEYSATAGSKVSAGKRLTIRLDQL
ncbi:MAG: hypothetical protein Q7U10_10295 [Thermodesulfovibrionia bacterium]|nr:hypothetical protein [Thermodesulfovibrionia bacterium]